ncbi:MAG TPA: hypothetical protein IAB87_00805 [Candidatus Coprenecus merdipullorum]|nr:hypothetical protein [Candidatus Coprenecus merdipullorum]
MKKNLFLSTALAAAVILVSACEPDKTTEVQFNALSETTIDIDKNGGICEFKYEIVNPTPKGVLTAELQEGVDWITGLSTQEYGKIRFNVEISEEETAREAVISLNYEGIGIDLTVRQGKGEYIPPYSIYIHDVSYLSAKWDITAKDKEMTYLNMIVDKATWDSFPTFEEYLAYNMEALTINAAAKSMTLEEYLEYNILISGDTTDISVSSLVPDTEYVVYAFGFTPEQELLSEVSYETFKTDPIQMLDVNFNIECTPSFNSVTMSVTPPDNNLYYMYAVTEGTGHSPEEIMDSYQIYVNSLIQEFLSYGAAGVDITTIVDWIASKGPVTEVIDELTPLTGYTAYALSIDPASGVFNSLPTLVEFTTTEEVGDWQSTLSEDYTLDLSSAVGTAECFRDYYGTGGYNWQIKLKPEDGVSCDELDIELVVNSTDFADGIVSGTYSVASDNSDPMPGEFLAGEYFYGYLYTWYKGNWDADGKPQSKAPATGGSITVTNHGDGTYTIDFSLKDDRPTPKTFSGSWTGKIDLKDRYAD